MTISDSLVQAIIFDMDGVLTDSEALINAAAVAMFRELGLEVRPEDFTPFIGTGENRYLGGVAEKYRFPIAIASAKKRTYEHYLRLVPRQLRAFPGARELVLSCRRVGLKTAVASSADSVKVHANLHQIGLPPDSWDAVISGEMVEHRKPAPDLFLSAARRMGVTPERCTVVEDTAHGIQAARAAGMRCVAVAQTFPAETLTDADVVRTAISEVGIADLTPTLSPTPIGFL